MAPDLVIGLHAAIGTDITINTSTAIASDTIIAPITPALNSIPNLRLPRLPDRKECDFYGQNEPSNDASPRAATALMRTNKFFCLALYSILYSDSLFIVYAQTVQRPNMRVLSQFARSRITHVVMSFNAVDAAQTAYNVTTPQDLFLAIFEATTPLVPNLRYFGINFWSPQFERLGISEGHAEPDEVADSDAGEPLSAEPTFCNLDFARSTIKRLVISHVKIEVFALLRNMQPRGYLNFNRSKWQVRKSLARNLRRCMKKLYSDP